MRIPSGKTDQLIFFVAVDSTDLKTRKTGLSSFTVYRSRNGGTATVYTTPTIAELSSANMPGVYSLAIDEDTTIASGSDSEEYCVHITQASMAPVTRTIELYRRDTTSGQTLTVTSSVADANTTKWNGTAVATPATAGIPDVNTKNINNVAAATPGASGGILISGSNSGTTTLAALTVTGATTHTGNVVLSDGLTISAPSTAGRAGITVTGNGAGAGIVATGGSTGDGIQAVGGASGHGLTAQGTGTTKHGVNAIGGATTSAGIKATGGATSGDGILVNTTSGHGLNLAPTGTSKHGLFATGGNGGTSDGISAVAGTGGVPIRGNLTGNITGTIDTVTTAVNVTTVNGLAANVITATAINTGAITAAKFAAGAIDAAAIAADAITAAKVADGTIDAATFAASAITATAIAADAITAAKIADGAIDAATFAAGAINAAAIAADAIGASELAADAAAEIAAAVWDLDATGHQTGGTFGQAIGDPAADTHTIYDAVVTAAAGVNIAADIIAIKAETASILTDTAEIGTAGAGLTNIDLPNQTMDIVGNITGNLSGSVGSVTGLTASNLDTTVSSRASPAQVNAEVVDALNVDTYAEVGQEAPAATQTLRKMIAFLYKAWRNKSTQTATTYQLYADDASTVDQKATVSDDLTTFTRGEIGSGP